MWKRYDVLNLEWASNSRDTNIIDPVLITLEDQYGWKVKYDSIWGGAYKILKYRPRLLLMSNLEGATENVLMAKCAQKLGIKVVSMMSEGVIKENCMMEAFWGNNIEHLIMADLRLVWSERFVREWSKCIPDFKRFNVKVSGATGFDRYQFYPFMEKKFFLNKYCRNEEKIVVIASYVFDMYFSENINKLLEWCTQAEIDYYRENCMKLREIYKQLIADYPNILYVLKYHPGVQDDTMSEFAGLEQMKNVVVIHNEERIDDLINICDLWVSFESTTFMEAWLLKKETISVRPMDQESLCEPIVEATIKVTDINTLHQIFEEQLISNIHIVDNRLKTRRESIINELIGHADGLNHNRAASMINELLKEEIKPITLNFNLIKKILKRELLDKLILYTPIGHFSERRENLKKRINMYKYNDRYKQYETYRLNMRVYDEKEVRANARKCIK